MAVSESHDRDSVHYTLKYGTKYMVLRDVSGLVTLEIIDYPLKLIISN